MPAFSCKTAEIYKKPDNMAICELRSGAYTHSMPVCDYNYFAAKTVWMTLKWI